MHIDWKSGTVISYNCMYLKFPKISKRFSSSLTRRCDLFRMTAKLFSFRKEVPNGWNIIRNVATELAYFLIYFSSASLLGARDTLC